MAGRALRGLWIAATAACIGGCQGSAAPPRQQTGSPGVTRLPVVGHTAPDVPANIDQALMTDPSAERLGDIDAALILYFHANQGMPGQLDDLRATAGPDLNLIAPSGQPYVYIPQGLAVRNSDKLLVVYDPQESPNGRRWCILAVQLRPGAPLSAEVIALSEALFRTYLASQP
jgi:hypothetical protein